MGFPIRIARLLRLLCLLLFVMFGIQVLLHGISHPNGLVCFCTCSFYVSILTVITWLSH